MAIHVGVSNSVDEFTLEKQAKKTPYTKVDNCDSVPCGYENPRCGPDCLVTDLQVESICETFNKGLDNMSLKAVSSGRAGKWVFIFEIVFKNNKNKKGLLLGTPARSDNLNWTIYE